VSTESEVSEVRAHLEPRHSEVGRPSIDPELMIRMLIVGYCFGVRSERRLCEEVHLNLCIEAQQLKLLRLIRSRPACAVQARLRRGGSRGPRGVIEGALETGVLEDRASILFGRRLQWRVSPSTAGASAAPTLRASAIAAIAIVKREIES
jgi:hypothetical protein